MIQIIPLTKEFCKEASSLESKYLSTAWSEKQLNDIVDSSDYLYVTAIENGKLLGVGGAVCVQGCEGEIFTVAVETEERGKGIGRSIVSALVDFCQSKNAENIFLEVEEGNDSAITLYTKAGFSSVGIRKGFYRGKNAIIMTNKL